MRIIALGGCGGMGRYAVRTVLDLDCCEQLVIADLDIARARDFAAECGPRVSAVEVDVTDADRMHGLLADADAVMTTVGPYYRFGLTILEAAIEAGCHYIDIADDWEPMLDMLALDERARDAGVTAIVGVGASPGLTNLMAAKAVATLDHVDELMTGWGVGDKGLDTTESEPGEGGTFGAALDHFMQQISGEIRVWRGGALTAARPLEPIEIVYPGAGLCVTHTIGHPEPLTLPRFRPEVDASYNLIDMPPSVIGFLRRLSGEVDAGKLTVREAAEFLHATELDLKRAIFSRFGPRLVVGFVTDLFRRQRRLPELFALATGRRGDRRVRVSVSMSSTIAGRMGGLTGVPLGVGMSLIADGTVGAHGVGAAERFLEPGPFFNRLAPLCEPRRERSDQLLVVTEESA